MTCPRCNTINLMGSVACATCGQPFVMGQPYPPPPQYGQPYGQPYMMAPQMHTRTSGMAIAGFVLSFLFCLAILGLIFSIIGYNESKQSHGQVKGEGLALAGIIISICMLLLMVAGMMVDQGNPR